MTTSATPIYDSITDSEILIVRAYAFTYRSAVGTDLDTEYEGLVGVTEGHEAGWSDALLDSEIDNLIYQYGDDAELAGFQVGDLIDDEMIVTSIDKQDPCHVWTLPLAHFIVSLKEEAGDEFTVHYKCLAVDDSQAETMAEQAYPDCEILHTTLIEEGNTP
jgi:hypothetical protein